MIQRFIELGKGYSDLYELLEIGYGMEERIQHLFAFHTDLDGNDMTSLAIALHPTNPGEFQPIYICREGIPNPNAIENKRFDLFKQLSSHVQKPIHEIIVRPSTFFAETDLYYQHLIGILRMNRYIAPMK
ncbi:Methylthioribose kinase [Pontibacillus halophilus JSM 076056 = DSM 19796]|uniref:Methylthioribose kinase n=1 Tax=Pontibacillus halophilus JSM 076056 = DSM 19796 TaxID=1385510 RepID=A0A0A5GMQ7_9BACI|nr:hypothetical protein [Pontibacillus halophilus]KGX93284.1 Methylthioribose kinase [Pontibacillus halophilus JSM 076056 = DSM 19796]